MIRHMIIIKLILIHLVSPRVWALENEKIVGGERNVVSNPEDYGYHVTLLTLYYTKTATNIMLCGGTIIGEQHVITAGHCMKKIEWADDIYIVLANHRMIRTSDAAFSKYIRVSEAFLPLDYDHRLPPIVRFPEFGVLKIEETFSNRTHPFIKILNLPTDEENDLVTRKGVVGTFLGRGTNKMGIDDEGRLSVELGRTDTKLRFTSIRTFPEAISRKYLRHLSCTAKNRICGVVAKSTGIEYYGIVGGGDSGGGLVYDGTLIGVLSASTAYVPGVPDTAFFVNVAYYKDVIIDVMNGKVDPYKIEKHMFD